MSSVGGTLRFEDGSTALDTPQNREIARQAGVEFEVEPPGYEEPEE